MLHSKPSLIGPGHRPVRPAAMARFRRHAPARTRALTAAACCLLFSLPQSGCRPVEVTPPNVLLITIDTLRADHLGSYGFEHDVSPRIDALAQTGVVFDRAIAASSKTAPSHAAIMTSGYTREHSIGHGNGTSRLSDRVTLAEIFRDAGYSTAAFVSNILLTRRIGFDRGFDTFDDDLTAPEVNRPKVVERLAPDTTTRAIDWLGARDAANDRPFFLWVHYQDPHGPYTPPEAAAQRFQLSGGADEPELEVGAGNRQRGGIPPYQALPGLRRASEYRSRYAGEIFFADEWVGKLIAAADAADARDTVVLLTADHGESFGEYGHYFKHTHTTTPDVAHVPLMLRAPGLAPDRRNEIVSHVDILPTLLALAGLPVPEDSSGVALVDRAGTPLLPPDRYVYCDNGGQLTAYRGDSFHWLVGIGLAWRNREDPDRRRGNPYSAFFHWNPAGGWERPEDKQALPVPVREYSERSTTMTQLPRPNEAEVERLRALGYVD